MKKTRMMGYRITKKFENMFTDFDRIHKRDGRTDRQTPRHGIDRAIHSVARQKCAVLVISDASSYTVRTAQIYYKQSSGKWFRFRYVNVPWQLTQIWREVVT